MEERRQAADVAARRPKHDISRCKTGAPSRRPDAGS